MAKTMDEFVAGLRQDMARWKVELAHLDLGVEGPVEYLQTSELRSWIEAVDSILRRYENRRV